MKSASFFFLSVAVHALVLASPVSFPRPKPAELIPVTVLEPELPGGIGQSDRSAAPAAPAKSSPRKSSMKPRPVETKVHNDAPQNEIISSPELLQTPSSTALFVPPQLTDNKAHGEIEDRSSHEIGNGVSQTGDYGTGAGSSTAGQGNGNGQGNGGNSGNLTQARYRETPKPVYPESAREQGREGTVLLRVLVDEQGRAKKIEISKSSGDDSLDRAAGEAIKRWRFAPAHYGDKAVESWIRIPVDFRLANANSRQTGGH